MQMTPEIERINEQRRYWMDKMHEQVTRMNLASFEGNKQEWQKYLEDIETAAIIIWRFDRKLANALNNSEDLA